MNNSPFTRSFQYTFRIEENEIDIPFHEYIFKYVLMHGSGLLLDRFIRRIGCDSRTFTVTYIFNDMLDSTDEKIIEELQKLGVNFKNTSKGWIEGVSGICSAI